MCLHQEGEKPHFSFWMIVTHTVCLFKNTFDLTVMYVFFKMEKKFYFY